MKIVRKDDFPLKIYQSDMLEDALSAFEIKNHMHKKLKVLFKDKTFRKAILYLFWVFVALKFKSCSFGDIDHFNGKDLTT